MPNKINNLSGMPQMSLAFRGWTIAISLIKITQTVDSDGFVQSTEETISFDGTVQPLSAEQIEQKPAGQRAYQWLQIHAITSVNNLQNNDQIMYDGKKYKVMGIKDYKLNNYIEYHVYEVDSNG